MRQAKPGLRGVDGVAERLDGVAAEVVGLRRDLAVDRRILRRHDAQIAQIQKRVAIGRRR